MRKIIAACIGLGLLASPARANDVPLSPDALIMGAEFTPAMINAVVAKVLAAGYRCDVVYSIRRGNLRGFVLRCDGIHKYVIDDNDQVTD